MLKKGKPGGELSKGRKIERSGLLEEDYLRDSPYFGMSKLELSTRQQPSQVVIAPAAGRLVWFAEEGINMDRHIREGHYWTLVPRVSVAFDPDADLKNAAYLMEAHLIHLRNMFCRNNSTGKIIGGCKLLGQGVADQTSTQF